MASRSKPPADSPPHGEFEPRQLTPAELEHFSSIPWAKTILQESLEPPQQGQDRGPDNVHGNNEQGQYVAYNMPARVYKDYTDEDGYFAGTLGTSETIPFLVTLVRRRLGDEVSLSLPTQPPAAGVNDNSNSNSKSQAPPSRAPDTITLVSMSTPGLSGHPLTAHGGVLATLFDESMSHAIEAHYSALHPSRTSGESRDRDAIYTAQLNVRYKRPVYTPGLLVIYTWCVARNSRKYWAMSQAIQEPAQEEGLDGQKIVCAEASSLWVIARNEKL